MPSCIPLACEVENVKLTAIKKQYGDTVALEIPEIEFANGEITAVLGESGAGKSTLLGVISGMVSGDGTVEGVGRVSYLFQSAKLLPNLTVLQNLMFVLPKGSDNTAAMEMLARVGLQGKEGRYPRELSGGEKQRVAVARAFLFPHDTLLMDEPFSAIDLSLKKSLVELVVSLWREKRSTVIFVTHDVHEAAILSHCAVVIKKGRVLLDIPVTGELPRDFFNRHPVESELVRTLV